MRSQPAQHGAGLRCPANHKAKRFRAPECGYIHSSLREERLGEKGGAFFNGKEGRDDFRTPFLKGKEGRVGFQKTSSLMVKKVSVPCKGNRKDLKDY